MQMMSTFEEIMRFDVGNQVVFEDLCGLLKKEGEILPFVGAGMSAFTYRTWSTFLLELAKNLDFEERLRVENLISMGEYGGAADLLNNRLKDNLFYIKLAEEYSESKINDHILEQNAAFLIPQLCHGNCITTNYDRVLEHACFLNRILFDKALPNNTNHLNTYLRNRGQKSALIFKIHGDILSNRNDIVLTGKSYNEHYGENKPLRKQLIKWIDSRKLLFLGASLKQDRTVEILKERMEQGMCNYTIYGCKKEEISALKDHFETLNILAIFYDSNDHNSMKEVLSRLLQEGLGVV